MKNVNITRFPALSYACQEAVNTLCTNLSFSGENVRRVMVTSCHASEGKSFVTMNLMRTLARLGKTVALVDADLRKSCIQSRYGLQFANPQNMGLAHYLAGMADMADVVYQTDIPGAVMVPIGREVSNALPLLNSPRLNQLLSGLSERVEYVLVDAPPVGAVIDAAQIARGCDGTLLVVNYNTVHRQELIDAKEQLEQTDCPILGTVMNMVEYDRYMGRKYGYRSYYSAEEYNKKGR